MKIDCLGHVRHERPRRKRPRRIESYAGELLKVLSFIPPMINDELYEEIESQ